MRIGLLDSAYRKSELLGLGLSWLKWELSERHGVETVTPEQADVVLASVQSQQALPDLRRELKRHSIDPRTRPVVIGGPGAYAPAVFDALPIAGACVGEGRRFVSVLVADGLAAALKLPETWMPGETQAVIPHAEFPFDCPPIRYQDGTTRLWVSRGCKRKCLFCQTGWERAYQQRPDLETVYHQAAALSVKGETIFCTSNDQSELDWARLPKLPHMSATMAGLREAMRRPGGINNVRSVRVGVEGVSARLRSAVCKPIATQELVDTTIAVMERGVTFRWFMIAGLPGETDADYDDLKAAIMHLKRYCRKGAVMLHFHAFLPHPAAPLCIPAIDDGYWQRFERFRRWFFDGPGLTPRVQVMPCAQPATRMKQAMLNMAATEKEVRRGWWSADNRNWRVRYVGTPDTMRRLARRYLDELDVT